MDEEASEETAVPSFTPVAELEKTALELSTVKKVQTEKRAVSGLSALPRRGDHRRPPRHSLIWGSMALERAARSVGVFMGSL
jgi:hypothetical protein